MADKTDVEKLTDAENGINTTSASNIDSFNVNGVQINKTSISDQITAARFFNRKVNKKRVSYAKLSLD